MLQKQKNKNIHTSIEFAIIGMILFVILIILFCFTFSLLSTVEFNFVILFLLIVEMTLLLLGYYSIKLIFYGLSKITFDRKNKQIIRKSIIKEYNKKTKLSDILGIYAVIDIHPCFFILEKETFFNSNSKKETYIRLPINKKSKNFISEFYSDNITYLYKNEVYLFDNETFNNFINVVLFANIQKRKLQKENIKTKLTFYNTSKEEVEFCSIENLKSANIQIEHRNETLNYEIFDLTDRTNLISGTAVRRFFINIENIKEIKKIKKKISKEI